MLVAFFLSVVSASAYANWTGASKIVYLSIKASGDIYFKLEGFVSNKAAVVCDKDTFILRKDSSAFKARADALLFIYASGKPVEVSFYSCDGAYYAISSMTLRSS